MANLPGKIMCSKCGKDITEWCINALLNLANVPAGIPYAFRAKCECGRTSEYKYHIPRRKLIGCVGIGWMFEPVVSKYTPPEYELNEDGMIKRPVREGDV